MREFRGVDFYQIDALLSEEERMVRDTVREFVSDRVMPIIEECFREGRFPTHLVPAMAELGLFGANLKGYGCAGLSSVGYGLILQELERGDSGVRSAVSVQGSLCMWPIFTYGSEAQKERWLPRMARGEVIGCFGLTEPDHGSDPGGMETRAVRKGDRYVINGTKRWITNGTIADLAVVWAKLQPENKIRGFLVEKGTPGFSAPEIPRKWSLRASVTSDLILEDCEVPAGNLLPGVEGLKGPLGCLNNARFGIAWGAIGSMMATYEEAVEYAKHRVQFDRPIAGFQLTQAKFADMLTEITKAQLLALRLGRLKDAGQATPAQVSLAKRNNVYWALEMARMGRQVLGASGITDEYQAGRHMANIESVITYEGTHEIHTLVLGQEITGLSAFK